MISWDHVLWSDNSFFFFIIMTVTSWALLLALLIGFNRWLLSGVACLRHDVYGKRLCVASAFCAGKWTMMGWVSREPAM